MVKIVNKKSKGLSLIEMVIAMGLLAVVTAGILGMFTAGTQMTAASYKLTMASFTGQLHMEELIGLTEEELRHKVSGHVGNPVYWESDDYNGFPIRGSITFKPVIDGKTYENLAEAVITVYDRGFTKELFTMTNIINITAGGYN